MGRKMLIINASLVERQLLTDIFSSEYEVVGAKTQEQALLILNKNNIDIIIADTSGAEIGEESLVGVIRNLKNYKRVPIIALTVNSPSAQEKAVSEGANDFITRPFSASALKNRIKNACCHYDCEVNLPYLLETFSGGAAVYKVSKNGIDTIYCTQGIANLVGKVIQNCPDDEKMSATDKFRQNIRTSCALRSNTA